MIEKIKTALSQQVSLQSKSGLFFSAFDRNGGFLASHGVVKTDRILDQLLQNFYQWILQKLEPQIGALVFDIVEEVRLQNDPNVLVKLSMKEWGIFLVQGDGQNSGVLLPNTKGIDTIQQWLTAIKEKYRLNSQVSVFVFKTKRCIVNF